jgi:hypothetical protein
MMGGSTLVRPYLKNKSGWWYSSAVPATRKAKVGGWRSEMSEACQEIDILPEQ